MKRIALLFLLAASGCLEIAPADGALHCSSVGSKCPGGYYCADDNTCWHTGTSPALDLSAGGGTDDLGGGGDDGGSGNDLSPPPVSFCMVPGDCTTPLAACLSPVCVGSVCGSVGTAQGTAAPPSTQVAGDCQTRICDGNGNVIAKPDNTNLPVDATGGCNTPGCTNGAPTMTPTASGTACTQRAGGICNGAGVCGVCKPGTSQCAADGKTIQNCSTDGQWVNGTVCSFACTAGACSGSCNMGTDMPYCSGIDQLHTCDASHHWSVMTCTYACSGTPGACTGTCKPSGNVCSGNTITWCDATGTPKSMACTGSMPVCLSGSCVQCSPNAVQCCTAGNGFAGNQTCGASGTWGTCNACGGNSSYTCSGAGVCGCTPDDPCANQVCGSAVNSCGTTVTCPNTCADNGEICAYNSTTHSYYCRVPATTTSKTCCGTTSACCSSFCC
jgi:hypothetical protein